LLAKSVINVNGEENRTVVVGQALFLDLWYQLEKRLKAGSFSTE
jgi:hypothetical protein